MCVFVHGLCVCVCVLRYCVRLLGSVCWFFVCVCVYVCECSTHMKRFYRNTNQTSLMKYGVSAINSAVCCCVCVCVFVV